MTGRQEERKRLEKCFESKHSEFVAVYGRRRVGKTYLVKEQFKDRFLFWHTGLSPYDRDRKNLLQDQLHAFYVNLLRYGLKKGAQPSSWLDAFALLALLMESKKGPGKKVIFIDEMPWMDTARSRFIPAFEHFWNDWAAKRDDILLIVCGSATSWIEDNLIHNKGGLYGRLTEKIHLHPFTLKESREFYLSKGVKMSDYDLAQSYMIVGGIPYYMAAFDSSCSLAQNIDRLFFAEDAALEDEFDLLMGSLFVNPEQYKSILRFLSNRHGGYTREEIVSGTGIADGGGLTKQLKALIASQFIEKYIPFGKGGNDTCYRLCDYFCRFWITFMEKKKVKDPKYWENNIQSSALAAWRGFAFEDLCVQHVLRIKQALGVEGVASTQSAWCLPGDDSQEGSQIDLVIDRADNVVNLCEMKFYADDFRVSKEYAKKLGGRVAAIQEIIPRRKVVHLTLVTTYGVVGNEYSGIFQKIVTLEDLF